MIQNTSAMDRPVGRRRTLPRRLLTVALPAVVVLGAAGWLAPKAARWMSTERSVDLSRVRLGTVVRGDLERDLSVQGRVIAAFHPTSFSPASGIVSLRVRAGEVVDKGAVLATLDSPELQSRLEQERLALAALEAECERLRIAAKQQLLARKQTVDLADVGLVAAQRAMARADKSRREGIINDVEYETAQDELQRAELGLAHARQDADLERETLEFEIRNREHDAARQRLSVGEYERQVRELAIRAPVAGLVSRLDVDDRDAVERGQPLVTVVDLSAFEIEVLIPESYADEIGSGTTALVRDGTHEFAGEVRSVSPEVESGQVLAIVAFTQGSPEGLRQNQRVSTRLILDSRIDVLKVPRGPFLEGGGGSSAFVVDGNVAVRRDIRTGATSVGEVEVLSGLEVGEQIIISDTARYGDADRLFLRD